MSSAKRPSLRALSLVSRACHSVRRSNWKPSWKCSPDPTCHEELSKLATKAALHSYTLSLRYKLKGTPVKVLEIAPPWVQTDLLGSNNEPRAMPLAEFIEETMRVLGTDAEEVLVERAKPLRNNAGPDEAAFVFQFNEMMASPK